MAHVGLGLRMLLPPAVCLQPPQSLLREVTERELRFADVFVVFVVEFRPVVVFDVVIHLHCTLLLLLQIGEDVIVAAVFDSFVALALRRSCDLVKNSSRRRSFLPLATPL